MGPAVPAGEFGCRVHSVFAAALNLLLDDRRFVVTLLPAGAAEVPQGIRLASCAGFEAFGLTAGDRGRRLGSRLTLDGSTAEAQVVVELGAAVRLPPIGLPHLEPRDSSWRDGWWRCARRLAARQDCAGCALRLADLMDDTAMPGSILSRRLAEGARELGSCVRAGAVEGATRAAVRLLGLGEGFTPSGDDFLCGLAAALRCTDEGAAAEPRFGPAWESALALRLEATNVVSATFLTCAFAGSFAGALGDLATALAGSGPGASDLAPEAALDRLCAMGQSSGMDTATGFLFGLSVRTGAEMRRYAA